MTLPVRVENPRLRNLREALLGWAKSNLRDFPWRHPGTSAYSIMVAELLLKRTTATAASRAYDPFIEKYPTIDRLALASEGELTELLKPIGLSRQRARAIRQLARVLMQQGKGVPQNMEQLRALPGIGDYAARAILSFAYDVPIAVADGNVARVMQRVFQDANTDFNSKTTQRIVDELLPHAHHRNFNFALLDIGALICRPRKPLCVKCPLQSLCDYAFKPTITRTNGPLKSTRLARGLSLSRLAKKAGVSKLTIINIEAERTAPRMASLIKIAQALGVPVEKIRKR